MPERPDPGASTEQGGRSRLGDLRSEDCRCPSGELGMATGRAEGLGFSPGPRASVGHERVQHRVVELVTAAHRSVRREQGSPGQSEIAKIQEPVIMATILTRFVGDDPLLARYSHSQVRNWRGTLVGEMRCVAALRGGKD